MEAEPCQTCLLWCCQLGQLSLHYRRHRNGADNGASAICAIGCMLQPGRPASRRCTWSVSWVAGVPCVAGACRPSRRSTPSASILRKQQAVLGDCSGAAISLTAVWDLVSLVLSSGCTPAANQALLHSRVVSPAVVPAPGCNTRRTCTQPLCGCRGLQEVAGFVGRGPQRARKGDFSSRVSAESRRKQQQ